MKITYFNDERANVCVKIQGTAFNEAVFKGEPLDPFFHILFPAESGEYDLDMPEGSQLFIKKWPGIVMISYIDTSPQVESIPADTESKDS